MKKTTSPRRLSLSRQTLRDLNKQDLIKAGGGKDEDSDGFTCWCSETCTACDTHYFSGCGGCNYTDGC